jgi:hypothetical protein
MLAILKVEIVTIVHTLNMSGVCGVYVATQVVLVVYSIKEQAYVGPILKNP